MAATRQFEWLLETPGIKPTRAARCRETFARFSALTESRYAPPVDAEHDGQHSAFMKPRTFPIGDSDVQPEGGNAFVLAFIFSVASSLSPWLP
jgi:hypothetical protein